MTRMCDTLAEPRRKGTSQLGCGKTALLVAELTFSVFSSVTPTINESTQRLSTLRMQIAMLTLIVDFGSQVLLKCLVRLGEVILHHVEEPLVRLLRDPRVSHDQCAILDQRLGRLYRRESASNSGGRGESQRRDGSPCALLLRLGTRLSTLGRCRD